MKFKNYKATIEVLLGMTTLIFELIYFLGILSKLLETRIFGVIGYCFNIKNKVVVYQLFVVKKKLLC